MGITPAYCLRGTQSPEDVLLMIASHDARLSNWSSHDWLSLSQGANSAAVAYSDPRWHRVAVAAAKRLRRDPDAMSEDEISSRLALLSSFGPNEEDELRSPSVLAQWAHGCLESWTPRRLERALASQASMTRSETLKTRQAARARATVRRLAHYIALPDELDVWR